MTLEEQLRILGELGLCLNQGVTIDDLLYSFDRAVYEREPFGVLLFMLGAEVEREPWGRRICDRVWNFDTECITSTGDYSRIVKKLCALAGCDDRLQEIDDELSIEDGVCWLSYVCDGKERHWPIEVRDDWADTLTLCYVMADIEQAGQRFYSRDNGQAMVLFYLTEDRARAINALREHSLTPLVAD